MGYNMTQHYAEFFIPVVNRGPALEAMKELARGVKDFHWVRPTSIIEAQSFEAAMDEWAYDLSFDKEGNVDGIEFTAEKLGDEELMFRAIAPFVRDGSYIEMIGEEGNRWRWCFNDGKMVEKYAELSWD